MAIELREYQKDLIERFYKSLETNKNIMLQLPTGSGKTIVAIEIAKRWINEFPIFREIVWVTHRKELENQSSAILRELGLENVIVTSPIRLYNSINRGNVIPHPAKPPNTPPKHLSLIHISEPTRPY